MGYMGLGMQRWISNMKPRRFLGKRSKPDGGGVEYSKHFNIGDYYHLEKRAVHKLKDKKYSAKYKATLKHNIKTEKRINAVQFVISITIALLAIFLLLSYFNDKFNWF